MPPAPSSDEDLLMSRLMRLETGAVRRAIGAAAALSRNYPMEHSILLPSTPAT